MKFFEQTRVLRLKTIFMLMFLCLFAGATLHSAIYIVTPEFMRGSSMLPFAFVIAGMSVCLPFTMYFLMTDLHNNHKNQDQNSAHD